MQMSNTLYVTNRDDWRKWLSQHFDTQSEIWLIFYKKHSGKPRLPYDDAVEEALCYGWIDSVIQRIDDEKYAQKFSPRRSGSRWSDLNKRRVAKMIREGRMTEAGLAKIDFAQSETETQTEPPVRTKREPLETPDFMVDAFQAEPQAWQDYQALPPSHRRNYILWISSAKRPETRAKRISEAIAMLLRGEKLGMK